MSAVTTKQKMTIYILPEAYAMVRSLVNISTLECSMLGEVELNPHPGIKMLITKIFIPFQTRMGTETTINAAKLPEVMEAEGIDHQKLKCWFHSHVNMAVHPSGQDETQIATLMEDADWFIRGIFNKRNEYNLSVHWMGVEIEAQLEIYHVAPTVEETALKTLLESRTEVSTYTPVRSAGYNGYSGSGFYNGDDENGSYGYNTWNRRPSKAERKRKKKIKRLTFEEFKIAFPGKGNIDYLNYLKNNENDFASLEIEESEDADITAVNVNTPTKEVTIWETA